MEHPGVAGEANLATKKKDLEREREAGGAFSIRDILGSRNSGRKKKPDEPPIMPPILPPPLPPTHLPLFHPIPPIFPFLPFNYNSQTYQSSPPVQKKVGTPLGVLLSLNIIFQKLFPIYCHQESCQEFPLSKCSQSQVRTAFSRAQTETLEAQFGKQVQFCISRLPIAGLFKVGLEHENSFNV